jgi:GH15 family glucan-1,4-alpha-glucosidase
VARPIVLSNGELHVGLNKFGLVHDFYYPYVGFENHSAGSDLRHKIGVFVDGKISWLDDDPAWEFSFHYPHTALIGHTRATHAELDVILEFDDTVDSEMSLFMRNIHVISTNDAPREIKLYMHQAFTIGDSRSGTDTAQYLPDSNAILHYRGRRAFVISGRHGDQPFDQYTIGLFGIEGHEGSFRDAEDGELTGNNIEHGRVDSILGFTLQVAAHSSERVHYWISAGMSIREALYIHKQTEDDGISKRLHSTASWWHIWLEPALKVLPSVPEQHRQLFIDSMMIIKSQIDKRGATIASTDTTMLNYSRDAYGYSWPRDGAYAVWPLIRLGYVDEPYRFFEFTKRGLHASGYLMHKYRADGALGSSWHSYVHEGGVIAPPIQEDETAVVVFIFAQFYHANQDSKLIKEFYTSMIEPMANFLSDSIEQKTGLPQASYDLWEESFATFTYTTSVTYGALLAASELATIAGDNDNAVKWRSSADDIRVAAKKQLYNEDRGVFYKSVNVINDEIIKDATIDASSIFGAFMFGLFDLESSELTTSISTMISTFGLTGGKPGLPRYENDTYRRTDESVTGNWWFITTLWHAQYLIAAGKLDEALAILDWTKSHAMSTGMLGEQLNPTTGEIIAPAPLTWSHAEYVSTVLDLIEKTKN